MRALVLGATGFAGKALTARLRELGHEAVVLLRPGQSAAAASFEGALTAPGELGDPNSIAVAARDCEVIFHCAGENARRASAELLAWVHVAGTENVIAAARHAAVRRVVLLSCADATLCNADRMSWKEDAVLGQAPLGSWARSKLLAEEVALQQSDRDLCVTALRPGFVWGPGERTVLPSLCREARRGGARLFGDGQNLVATLYIDNLVDALIAAAEADDPGGQAFHVNDGEHLDAREFFGMLCEAVGLPPPRRGLFAFAYTASVVRALTGRPGPLPDQVVARARGCLLDCLRAATTLDFRPRVGVEEGKQALARWATEVGGPEAIERLERQLREQQELSRFAELAATVQPAEAEG